MLHLTRRFACGVALSRRCIRDDSRESVGAHHPIEIIVPAGTGGGADQMARTVQGIIGKHNLVEAAGGRRQQVRRRRRRRLPRRQEREGRSITS